MCAQSLQSCLTLCDPMDCIPPGSSAQGILLARILEWVVMPSSMRSSWPRDQTWISCIVGGLFTHWVTSFKNRIASYKFNFRLQKGISHQVYIKDKDSQLLAALKSPGGLVKPGCWTPTAGFLILKVKCGPRICLSNKFSGDANVTGRGPYSENLSFSISISNQQES